MKKPKPKSDPNHSLKLAILESLIPCEYRVQGSPLTFTRSHQSVKEIVKQTGMKLEQINELLYELRDEGKVDRYVSSSGVTIMWRLTD